ncbi:hypothetical protein HDV62DRAFT_385713 [Trichoderma sp. SZMC 28011]
MVSITLISIKIQRTCLTIPILQAQTLEQRRRNAKFAKDQENKMGKSEDQLKKRTKETPKSPISLFWLAILGFVVFGGLVFELLSRFFGI